jgi:hypothetical protein
MSVGLTEPKVEVPDLPAPEQQLSMGQPEVAP